MNIVIVDCFDTWEHRVDLLHSVLTNEGHVTKCLLSDFRHFEKVYRTEDKLDYIFFHALSYEKNISIKRVLSHVKLAREIFHYIDEHAEEIDLLWVLAPPNIFVKHAAKIKIKHHDMKLIIDLIDLWPETMPLGKVKKVFSGWRKLRDNGLKYADFIVTECNLYRSVLRRVICKKKVETLYLARENKGYLPCISIPQGKISLCYLGSINNIIDIEGIVKVINLCMKSRKTVLHIIGEGEKKDELTRKVKATGADIIDHGKVYDQGVKQQIFDSCNFGLNMMKETVCVGLTMKSIDYFEFGLPIINNIHGDTWELINEYNCGVNIDTKSKDENQYINNFLAYDMSMRTNSRKVFEEQLSKDIFRKKVCKIIEEKSIVDE